MKKIRVLETFSGIGAPRKALERLGYDYEIVDSIEIDPYPVTAYNAIFNDNIVPQDITTWNRTKEELGEIDLLWNSSPCTDISIAGRNEGAKKGSETRSSLVWEVIRIAKEIQPKFIVWENVKNLTSKKHISVLNEYIGDLEEIGYKSTYRVLNATSYGIPQNRERVFVVSIRKDIDKTFIFPTPQTLELRLKDMLEDEVDEKYYLSDELISKITQWKAYQKPFERVLGKESICPTLTARGAGENHSGMITYSDKLEHTTNLQEELVKGTSYLRDFGSRGKLQEKDGVCDTLTASMGTGGGNVPIVKTEDKGYVEEKYKKFIEKNGYIPEMFNPYNECEIEDVAPTQATNCGCTTVSSTVLIKEKPQVIGGIGEKKSNNGKQWYQQDRIYDNEVGISLSTHFNPYYIDNYFRIRKLTPKECFRLMGFDDIDFNRAKESGLSDSRLYKCAGNSVVVNVIEAIFRNLFYEYTIPSIIYIKDEINE